MMDILKNLLKNHIEEYLDTRKDVFGERKDKFVCLMDLSSYGYA